MRFTGTRRQWLQAAASLVAAPVLAQDDQTGGDPLGSMQYPGLREQTIGKASARFTDQVLVKGPAFADDAMNVPLLVDARGLDAVGGGVQRIRVSVDRNPVRQVLDFEPLRALPMLAFRIRMEQASPSRVCTKARTGEACSMRMRKASMGNALSGSKSSTWRTGLRSTTTRISAMPPPVFASLRASSSRGTFIASSAKAGPVILTKSENTMASRPMNAWRTPGHCMDPSGSPPV